MNFPENQRIGALAEQDVTRLFTSWGWGVGQDYLDSGYDLNVEPDRTRFRGARFLVQVKGTAKSKRGAVIAKVSKKRLREYLTNPHPVLIVRALSDGSFFWIHAQAWAQANRKKLEGSGDSGVKLERTQVLSDRAVLEAFLDKVLQPPAQQLGAISDLAKERSHFLSSIDPRLRVKFSADENQETYEIFAKADDVSGALQFRAYPDPGNRSRIRDIFGFGLPGTLAVEGFRLEGSPLFDAIGANAHQRGELTIRPTNSSIGNVRLYAGEKASPFAPSISIPAELFRGHHGLAVKSTTDSIVNLNIRAAMVPEGSRVDVSLGVMESVYGQPIKELQELADMSAWTEAALEQKAMVVELLFGRVKARIPIGAVSLESMNGFLRYVRFLGQLHLVAHATDSEFEIHHNLDFDDSDYSNVSFAYALLRGERSRLNVGAFEVTTRDDVRPTSTGEFLVTTTIVLKVASQDLCRLPVRIELPGYELQRDVGSDRARLVKGPNAEAWATYSEGTTEVDCGAPR